MKNKYKCIDCNHNYPCWMIVEFPPINPKRKDHPVDKKLLKKCIMDRKAEAHFTLQVRGRPKKVKENV